MKSNRLKVSVIAMAIALMTTTGCQTLQEKTGLDGKTVGAGVGAGIGCLGGAVVAKLAGKSALGGCAIGAIAGGIAGFEIKRREELAAAETAQKEAIAALSKLPAAQASGVKANEIKTVDITATDKVTKEQKKMAAFESVSIDMPTTARGTKEYEEAMSKLKTLAERVADERGTAVILVEQPLESAKAKPVATETNSVKTAKGNTIIVTKSTDPTLARGIQRVTVKAGVLDLVI